MSSSSPSLANSTPSEFSNAAMSLSRDGGLIRIHVRAGLSQVEAVALDEAVSEAAALGQPVALCVVVEARTSLPSEQARQAVASLFHRHQRNIVDLGIAIDGPGFWVSAYRSVVTTALVVSRARFRCHVSASAATTIDSTLGALQVDPNTALDMRQRALAFFGRE